MLKIPKTERPNVWIRLPRHKWPKSWSNIEDPVVPLERHLYGHPSAGLSWERQFEEASLELGWEKVPKLAMCVRSKKTSVIYDMEGHARKCVERYCELANKKVEQLYKFQVLAWMIIISSRRNSNQLENYREYPLKIVLKCLYLKCLYFARIRQPDILWSVNKLARSVTKRFSGM